MIRAISLIVATGALMSAWQSLAAEWAPINRSESVSVSAAGNVLASGGANLEIENRSSKPGGAIASVSAESYVGRTIVLQGRLTASEAVRTSGLWLRVDGENGPLLFRTTEANPVRGGESGVDRRIEASVPAEAKRIAFGASISGVGTLRLANLVLLDGAVSAGSADYHAVMQEALAHIEANAYFGSRVQWDRFREKTNLTDASEYQAHRLIADALKQLRDGHSRLLSDNSKPGEDDWSLSDVRVSVADGIGYVSIPSTAGLSRAGRDSYATSICTRLSALNDQAPLGWLVDLRNNGGGSMWPMLQALKPLLGSAEVGRMVSREGSETPWEIRDVAGCSADLSSVPVAVLFNGNTASAAEAVAIAFVGRGSTKSFGTRTAGQANANRSFDLADGSLLLVMSALYKDRDGHLYVDSFVQPDMPVQESSSQGDAELTAAKLWLRSLRK